MNENLAISRKMETVKINGNSRPETEIYKLQISTIDLNRRLEMKKKSWQIQKINEL